MEFDPKKVLQITSNILKVLDNMEHSTEELLKGTQKFNQFMQDEISENSIQISREILQQIKNTKEIINESTNSLSEGAQVLDVAEDMGRKLRGNT